MMDRPQRVLADYHLRVGRQINYRLLELRLDLVHQVWLLHQQREMVSAILPLQAVV